MSDIIRRLRDPDPAWKEDDIPDLLEDAAMEIERLQTQLRRGAAHAKERVALQAENERLRAALQEYANADNWSLADPDLANEDVWLLPQDGYVVARDALKGGE